MEWLKMLAVLCVIVLLAIIDHEPIGDTTHGWAIFKLK